MIKPTNLFVISCAVIGAYFVHHAYAVSTAPAAFSQYGQIQAVKNYSSNPFWNPNSPYNQKAIPKPIYVTGADLNTGDCNRIVENLVASFCASNNNCTGMRLADVRPTIMVQLSQLPGHNFATSCGGYIDSMFNKYAKSGTALNLPAPTGTTTGTATFQFKNPYEIKPTAEQQAVADRAAELAALQAQTGGVTGVSAAAFPKTVADLSFTDRMANAAEGYEPYKEKSAYIIPDFENDTDGKFLNRLKTNNLDEYCRRFPETSECKCYQDPNADECQESKYATELTDDPKSKSRGMGDGGEEATELSIPSCIQNLSSFASFRSAIRKAMETESVINKNTVEQNKTTLYPIIAREVVELCITQGSALHIGQYSVQKRISNFELDLKPITEFNNWLYHKDSLPIPLPEKKGKESVTVEISAEELLSYSPITIPTSVLVINRTNLKPYDSLTDSAVDREYFFEDKCSDRSIGGHSDHSTTIHRAAKAAGFKHNCENGLTFFLDYPLNKERRVFPGVLLESCASFLGQEHLITEKNYAKAIKTIRKFVDNINGADYGAKCSGQDLAVYVIMRPLPEDKVKTVRRESPQETVYILAGPYLIP